MSQNNRPFGLSEEARQRLLSAMRAQGGAVSAGQSGAAVPGSPDVPNAPDASGESTVSATPRLRREGAAVAAHLTSFEALPAYKQLKIQQAVARHAGIEPPYYRCHEGLAKARTVVEGREVRNFATYDYLDINGHPAVAAAVEEALHRYGTTASASRLTAGERPPHRALETRLAGLYGVEDCVVFVSGHATNISALAALFGPHDAIFYDALSHNSLVQGALLSGAARFAFPNNDTDALERLLAEHRPRFQRAVIISEGLFGMDGCLCPLPELVALKERFGCFLMVDEAHSLGVLGGTGRGVHEHFGLPATAVDIWMGTLSKSFCGCGGFIAGSAALVEFLKYYAPGFVYSVGMPPLMAAASAAAVDIMLSEPERVARLHERSALLLEHARRQGLDTGRAEGYAVIPVMVGDSLSTAILAQELLNDGVLSMPIIYPGVEEGQARLRFFVSAAHSEEDIRAALDATVRLLPVAREKAAACAE